MDEPARRLRARDLILETARHLCTDYDLPHAYLQRLESAAHHGDADEFLEAVTELLEAIEASR